MTLDDVREAHFAHLRKFVEWMADGWNMTDADLKTGEITRLPQTPDKAFQDGWNRACASITDAYELFLEQECDTP